MIAAVRERRALPVLAGHTTPPRTVRLSLTDRCDLACVYCRPSRSDGYFESRLSMASWRSMIAGLIATGIRRFRITGGEPLLDRRVVEFVACIASHPEVEDLALTTNATRLEGLASALRDAGLRRLTVSIDTLDKGRFARITRGGDLEAVLRGLEAAKRARFDEIKTNTVVVRDENDDEIEALTLWAWENGFIPRFIEVMRIGEGARLSEDRIVCKDEMLSKVRHLLADESAEREPDRGPAKYIRSRDGANKVGFITGTSDTYCDGCDRLRVSADGVVRPCLATNDGVAASDAALSGDANAVTDVVNAAWKMKPDGSEWRGCTESTARHVSIRAIGG